MTSGPLQSVRAVTFDMYGTLLDLEATFREPFGRFLSAKGSSRSVSEVVHLWEASYLRESMVDTMLGRGRTPFDRIRRHHLGQVFSQLGVEKHPRRDRTPVCRRGRLQPVSRCGRWPAGAARQVHPGGAVQRRPGDAGASGQLPGASDGPGHLGGAGRRLQAPRGGLPGRCRKPETCVRSRSCTWPPTFGTCGPPRSGACWGPTSNRHGIPYQEDVPPDLEVVDLNGLARGLGA